MKSFFTNPCFLDMPWKAISYLFLLTKTFNNHDVNIFLHRQFNDSFNISR